MFDKILRILLFLLVFSLPLGQLGKVPGLPVEMGVYVSDLLLGVFCVAATVYLVGEVGAIRAIRVMGGSLTIILGSVFVLWAVACLALGASVLNSTELLISFSYWLRLALLVVFFAEIYSIRKVSPKIIEHLPLWLVFSGVVLAVAGFVQLLVFPDFGMLAPELGWDPHYFRLNSTFFDPNFTGAYLVLVLGGVGGIRGSRGSKMLILLVLLAAIFLTFSRSAWLMLAIVVFIYGLFKSRLLLMLALTVAFGAYFAVPRVQTRLAGITDPADSAQFRIASWQEGLQLSQKNLLTGVGFNALRYAKENSEAYDYKTLAGYHSGAGFDSSLLVVLATTGITGLLLFGGFYLTGLIGVIWSIGAIDSKRLLIVAALVALLVGSNFINSLFYAPIMIIVAAMLGLFVD